MKKLIHIIASLMCIAAVIIAITLYMWTHQDIALAQPISGYTTPSVPLSSTQLKIIAKWLETNRKGWDPVLYTPPPPSNVIYLKDSGGQEGHLDFQSNSKKESYVVIWWSNNPKDIVLKSFTAPELEPFFASSILK